MSGFRSKIVVKDAPAKIFLDDNLQPSIIVKDLKHASNNSEATGLFVDIGTEGFFSDLKVETEN